MDGLVWAGVAMSILGMTGIIYSIIAVTRSKRAGLDDDALRARLARILPVNLGALLVSVLGLMTVVIGILLG